MLRSKDLQVVCVFPNVHSQEREVRRERVLVLGCYDFHSLVQWVITEPTPSRTLNSCSSLVEVLLELVETAEVFVDGLL